jgi:iron complex transport system ATP-binding protein
VVNATDLTATGAPSYAFELEGVSVVRNGTTIVRDINWTVPTGENWVLLGANGIGKSTLMNIISTRMFPTTGSVRILGRQLGKVDVFELRKHIGILGADLTTLFLRDETVLNVVRTAIHSMTGIWGDERDADLFTPADTERARYLLELFGVLKLYDRPWGVLSQGERKRVLMARTLMSDPDLLLFDEPTAGLDLAAREQVINTLNKLALENRECGRNRTVILVNHNVEEIPPSFNKIAIMGRAFGGAGAILHQGDIKKNLTSRNLTEAYGIDLHVQRMANLRYFASTSVIIDRSAT